MIVSGDERREPILAYSETNSFSIDGGELPSGLLNWMEETSDDIRWIRKNQMSQDESVKGLWNKALTENNGWNGITTYQNKTNAREKPIDPSDCRNTTTTIGSFLSTTWGQQGGYRSSTIYSEDCSKGWGYLFFHMNWGWDNRHNSWYSFNNWRPKDDRDYKYNKRMIYNIKP